MFQPLSRSAVLTALVATLAVLALPLLGAVAPVGSRVEHDEGKVEALGALEVVEEGVHGARPLVR